MEYGKIPETQARTLALWQPAVLAIVKGFSALSDELFDANIEFFYPVFAALLNLSLLREVQQYLAIVLIRFGTKIGKIPKWSIKSAD